MQTRTLPRLDTGPIPVIVNAGGGAASRLGKGLRQTVEEAFAGAGVPVRVQAVDGADIAEAVRTTESELVVVGGGDGTLGSAAGALAHTGRSLGVLPLGTRNHLALELGIPADLAEAAKVIAAGHVRTIDLGCAGDRAFVNNCSVGLYPSLVRERERVRHGLPKWLATIPAAWRALRWLHSERFRLEWNGAEHTVETPLLFIGNNRYGLDAGRLGQRESLSDGVLSLAAVEAQSGGRLALMILRLLLGRADPERDFAALEDMDELCIYGHRQRHVALDGEVVRLRFPLRLSVLPGALRVVAPAPQAEQV